jgi:DNA-binding CsgD family transcriptional regulator
MSRPVRLSPGQLRSEGPIHSGAFRSEELVDLVRLLVAALVEERTPGVMPGGDDELATWDADGWHFVLSRQPADAAQARSHGDPQISREMCSALSPREHEIVRLVAAGYPNKTIAAVLDISPWTVATYLRRIFHKLRVSSRAEMVARALATGP